MIGYGVFLERGPRDYQVLQQREGRAALLLSGRWVNHPTQATLIEPAVYARVVEEATGRPVVDWLAMDTKPTGSWAGMLTVPAGGCYRLETCLDNTGQRIEWAVRGDMVHHFAVGDLYVIAGQSNAVGFGKEPVEDGPELGVHVFRTRGSWDLATHPLADTTGSAYPLSAEAANPGHSPWLAFGKRLRRATGLPIGLIPAALGAAPLSRWNPEEEGDLYGNMMEMIRACGGRVRGLLWYQGCADANDALSATYGQRFAALVRRFRADVGDAGCPVLTVQLNRCTDRVMGLTDRGWGTVREAQRQAARRDPAVYLAPAQDVPLADSFHNAARGNLTIGERVANLALRHIYAQPVPGDAPDLEAVERQAPDRLALVFRNVSRRMDVIGVPPERACVTVTDELGEVPLRHWLGKGERIVLYLRRPLEGQARVSGAWRMEPGRDLPMDMGTYLPLLSFYEVPET